MASGEGTLKLADPIHARIFELALPYLRTRENDVHTEICAGFAQRLLAAEGGDADVVMAGILLHDVGYSSLTADQLPLAFGPTIRSPELQRLHEVEGARLAREILAEVGFPPEKARRVAEIVDGHDTRKIALSREDALVKDADKLFRVSKRGFPIDFRRFEREPKAYLAWLGEQVDPWFFTETAKGLAREELEERGRELSGAGP